MINFNNKETGITDGSSEDKRKLGYANLLLIGINLPPKEGTTIPEMRKCFKISEILENAELGSDIEIEDEDFKFAVSRIPETWSVIHRDIIAFCDYVEVLSNGSEHVQELKAVEA